MHLTDLQAILISGLVLGSMYALMATGLSMVWGTLRVFNFAHGSLMMVGAYVTWTVCHDRAIGIGMAAGMVAGVTALFVIGLLIYYLLVRPYMQRLNLVLLVVITTLAGSIFFDNAAHILWGPRMKRLPRLIEGKVSLLGTNISAQEAVVIVMAPLVLLLLALLLKRTRFGMAIRGVEQNRDSARLLGVDVSAVYAFTFGLSAALAALAGIILGSVRFITPTMGADPLTRSFMVVILGGLGSMYGTMAAAYVVGLLEATCAMYVGLYGTPPILFLVMVLVLVFKPKGLFGVD
jgi:branched-chain amino acid transport system permease protein